jgi:hypothetical protein
METEDAVTTAENQEPENLARGAKLRLARGMKSFRMDIETLL